VAKAYQRLIENGVLADRRWEGTFIAEPPLAVSNYERKRLLYEEALRFATLVTRLGASSDEATWELMAALRTVLFRRGAVRIGVRMSQYGRKQIGGR
jgi:DNA-binding transcriptional regulator YhcF (GntR family)